MHLFKLEMLRNQQKIIYHDLLKCSLIVSFWSYCIIFLDVLSLFGWFRYTTKISSTLTYISAPWVSFHVYVLVIVSNARLATSTAPRIMSKWPDGKKKQFEVVSWGIVGVVCELWCYWCYKNILFRVLSTFVN